MLTESARILTSERVADLRPQVALGGSFSLTCRSCGGQLEMPFWQPQARCPHCQTLGYPDRARLNLLPLGWDCPSCGASNDGLHNFCTTCGAGLASRCQRCESPVYGATCLQCGEHQARPRLLRKGQSERIEWLPIQRERIEKQRARLREAEAEVQAEAPALTPPASPKLPRQAEARRSRQSRRRGSGKGRFGWWWLPVGLFFMMMGPFRGWASSQRSGQDAMMNRVSGPSSPSMPDRMIIPSDSGPSAQVEGSASMTGQPSDGSSPQVAASDIPATIGDAWAKLEGWWAAFVPSLGQVSALTPDDPEYAYLFGVLLIGLIALPFGLYIIDQLIRRLFP